MGHDHHFLSRLSRLDHDEGDHVDIALALYRDHEAVRFIIDHLSLSRDRVALALGAVDRGPYVVLATNGHFVTCLGEGMRPGGLDIVPRERVNELLALHHDRKGWESAAVHEQRKNERRFDFFQRLLRRSHEMTREEFLAFASFAPLISRTLYWMSLDESKHLLERLHEFAGVERIKPAMAAAARSFHDGIWNVGHLILLAALGERPELDEIGALPLEHHHRFSTHCALTAAGTVLLRGVWAAARVGRMLLPTYEDTMRRGASEPAFMDGLTAVLAIGLQDERARPEARRLLELGARELRDDAWPADQQGIGDLALLILDDPTEHLAMMVKMGRTLFYSAVEHLPADDPYKFPTEEDVPEELAATMALQLDTPIYQGTFTNHVLRMVTLVTLAKAEDFYFPREVARRVLAPWTPELTLHELTRFHGPLLAEKGVPVRSEKVGRNDPCPCGSGKKYKKCHGA